MFFEKFKLMKKFKREFIRKIKSIFIFDNYKGVQFYELSGSNVFIITKDDLVYAFGENSGGCLGLGHNNPIKELKIIGSLCDKGIVEFSHGFNHVIARTNSDEIYCWGDCNTLQPKNISSNRSTKKPELNKFLSEKIIIDICCGFKHSLALTQLREVYGWGYNKHGQLGIGGDCDFQLAPMKVNGFNDEKVSAISCGSYHSLALTESGLVFSWGSNGRGQLGIGHTRNSIKPQLINNRSNVFIKKIRCGRFHSLLLSNDGDIYAFGSNDYGQLGIKESHDSMSGRLELRSEMKSDRNLPVKINHDAKFVDISTHFNYDISIALSSNCAYFIWGKCGEEIICYPRETKFKSLLDIFAFYFGITNRLIHISNNKCRDSIFKEKLVYEKEFSEICLIASGSFGIVCKAMKKNEEGIYAIKKIPLSEDQVDIAIREIKIMSSFDNDYTVKCCDAWIEENYFVSNFFKKHEKSGIESTHLVFDYHRPLLLYIQLELCSKTLKEIIEQLNEELNQKQTQTLTPIGYYICSELFREVLESVNYLHKQNIIHRDLKPENILITEGQNGRFVKIADFGLATIHEFEGQSHTKYKGTRKYSAPEVLNSRRYDTKADVYSLGVVVAELFNININEY